MTLFDVFEKYVGQWVQLETRKITRLELNEEERLDLCQDLAYLTQEHPESTPYTSINELETHLKRIHSEKPNHEDFELFVKDAHLSMFLERDPHSDGFRFSHEPILEFFLGRLIALDLISGRSDRIAATTLSRRRPLVEEFALQGLRRYKHSPEDMLVRTLKNTLRTHHRRISIPESSKSADRLDIPLPGLFQFQTLICNLVRLLVRARTGPEVPPIVVDLGGSWLALADLETALGDLQATFKVDRANLEFARLPDDKGKLTSLTSALFAERPEIPADLVERCRSPFVLAAKTFCSEHQLFGGDRFDSGSINPFILVPGGLYRIAAQHKAGPSDVREVLVPTFLIQRHPVTNGQFYRFTQDNPDWAPKTERTRSGNDYYLSGWPEDMKETEGDARWSNFPVTYVNWDSANAYALATGCRLPSELEWEVAGRFLQKDFAPYPWGAEPVDSQWEHVLEVAAPPPLLPNFDVSELPAKFKAFSDASLAEFGLEPPINLIGGVREWVLDVWSNEFPFRSPNTDQILARVNSGFDYDGSRWHATEREFFVLRGGSFQRHKSECRIESRAPQRRRNVNPDAGFRCVRPLRPMTFEKQ